MAGPSGRRPLGRCRIPRRLRTTRNAFKQAWLTLRRRIELLLALPLEKLDRLAREQHLRQIAQDTELRDDPTMKRVLFVCVENSNRSQMAEAFARIHGGDAVEALQRGLAGRRASDQPEGDPLHVRTRLRPERARLQVARRDRRRVRCRHHHGLRRQLPVGAGQAPRGLGLARSEAHGRRRLPRRARRDLAAREGACWRSCDVAAAQTAGRVHRHRAAAGHGGGLRDHGRGAVRRERRHRPARQRGGDGGRAVRADRAVRPGLRARTSIRS